MVQWYTTSIYRGSEEEGFQGVMPVIDKVDIISKSAVVKGGENEFRKCTAYGH